MSRNRVAPKQSTSGGVHGRTVSGWMGRPAAVEYAKAEHRAADLPVNVRSRVLATPSRDDHQGSFREPLVSILCLDTDSDEPNAPAIRIVNDVDQEPAPAFSFHYTNRMYHTNGVALPDPTSLQGCDCIGPCSPESATCSCVLRQMDYIRSAVPEEVGVGFAYDLDGRIRTQFIEYPIFECNAACRCSNDCLNRVSIHRDFTPCPCPTDALQVVQSGRRAKVNIKRVHGKGWGKRYLFVI